MELTPSELKLEQLRNEEQANKDAQKALVEQVEYDKAIREHRTRVENTHKDRIKQNERIKSAYNEFVQLGVGEYMTLEKHTQNISDQNSWNRDQIKPEDQYSIPFETLFIKTDWGDIWNFTEDMKAETPGSLTTQFRKYTVKTIA